MRVPDMINPRYIHKSPIGPFAIPTEPDSTWKHSDACCRSVLAGEYSYPRALMENVRSILDIGSNCGAFVVWACLEWWPAHIERVHAYEPNLAAMAYAETNWSRMRLMATPPPEIVREVAAVTPDTGAWLTQEENWGARHLEPYYAPDRVPVRTVDPNMLEPADVLKIDVEGAAVPIAKATHLWTHVKVAMYESHSAEERDALAAACRRAGLRMVRGNPEDPPNDVRCWVR